MPWTTVRAGKHVRGRSFDFLKKAVGPNPRHKSEMVAINYSQLSPKKESPPLDILSAVEFATVKATPSYSFSHFPRRAELHGLDHFAGREWQGEGRRCQRAGEYQYFQRRHERGDGSCSGPSQEEGPAGYRF